MTRAIQYLTRQTTNAARSLALFARWQPGVDHPGGVFPGQGSLALAALRMAPADRGSPGQPGAPATFAPPRPAGRRPQRIEIEKLAPDWLRTANGVGCRPAVQAARRVFDVVASLALLVLALPVLALTPLLIRLESRGPALYRQARVGRNGAVFTMLKFRSMRTDAESGGPAWAAADDPRVTRIGGFLRRSRIDELPQLLNVLRGEMSLVGPRPERPHFVPELAREIPYYRDRTAIKPGITGWAQVNYPYGASIEDARAKLTYDLYYVRHRSLMLDLRILLATVRVVLFQVGAR